MNSSIIAINTLWNFWNKGTKILIEVPFNVTIEVTIEGTWWRIQRLCSHRASSAASELTLGWTTYDLHTNRVSTASGNQGKLEGIFSVREKSGNLAFFKKIREKSGNFDDTIFFLYFDDIIFSWL